MEYASLIAEFGAHYGMEGLAPDENGAVGFDVDGRAMVLQRIGETDRVVATLELGEAPDAGSAIVNRLLMRANQALFVMDGMSLALHPEKNRYRLLAVTDIAALDFVGFDAWVAQVLDRADQWGELLEKFIPLAAEAEAKGTDEPEEPSSLSLGGDILRA